LGGTDFSEELNRGRSFKPYAIRVRPLPRIELLPVKPEVEVLLVAGIMAFARQRP